MTRAISIPELHWLAAQLLFIPDFRSAGQGEMRCREIGVRILEDFGHNGMVAVCEFVRDNFDRSIYRTVEKTWDGIGQWRG